MTQYNTCAAQIDSDCRGFEWPAGCNPTRTSADACISALSDTTRLATPSDMITECSASALCGP